MSAQVPITIKLCNRVYKIKTSSENEATVRATAHSINERLSELKKNFPGRDEQDYLAMCLIDQMTLSQEIRPGENVNLKEIIHQLESIHQLLNE